MERLTNLRVLKRTRPTLRRGDVFVMQLPSEYYLFGRVIIADAPKARAPMPGSNLIYIYDRQSRTLKPDLADLRPGRLLIPPVWTNKLGWTKGYFWTIDNRPLDEPDFLRQHCFSRTLARPDPPKLYVDETGGPLRRRIEPCGVWGLVSYRWIDDKVSDALGIPLVTLQPGD